jgi:hypothetical protein
MTPQRTVSDDLDAKVLVSTHSDLGAPRRGLSAKQVDCSATAFNDGVKQALVVADWLADEKDLPAAEGTPCVFFGEAVDDSEKAWRFAAGKSVEWVPKSQATLFVSEIETQSIATPQSGLGEFGGGGRA